MPTLRRLVLVRHGETIGQSSIRYHGINDVALSDLGRHQMRQVATALARQSFDAVYTSSLQRTVEAATIIAPGRVTQPIGGFDEINFGAWEGLTREEIAARDPELHDLWRGQLDEFVYPGGESVPQFQERVMTAFRTLRPVMPESVLIIAHKGVIRAIVAEVLQRLPERSWLIDLGSIHSLVDENGWRAEFLNRTAHLADPLPVEL